MKHQDWGSRDEEMKRNKDEVGAGKLGDKVEASNNNEAMRYG